MKPSKIKAWPELIDYLPATQFMPSKKRTKGDVVWQIEVDLGSVSQITSTGLTVFLLRLLSIHSGNSQLIVRKDCPVAVSEKLRLLGADRLLRDDLYDHQSVLQLGTVHKGSMPSNSRSIHIPIFKLRFQEGKRREALSHFVDMLTEQMESICGVYDCERNGIPMLLNEIAKNSADHSGEDALFGLDIIPLDPRRSRLTFAFGDLGDGIKRHIELHLPPEEKRRQSHMSLYEAYRLALKPGYTSNPSSGVNKGLGMQMIVDCANALGMRLSVFDASSRGILSLLDGDAFPPSHSAVRRVFHNIGHSVGFFYFGELILNKLR